MAKQLTPEDVLLAPILTEETWGKMEERKYAFRVALGANKIQIRKAVEELFDVKVVRVNVQNRKGKPRRTRFRWGYTKDWKKAIEARVPKKTVEVNLRAFELGRNATRRS